MSDDLGNDELPQPTWLEQAVERFGQPHVALDRIDIGDAWRSVWIFHVGRASFNLGIDRLHNGKVRATAGSPGRNARLFLNADPTDAELRSICEFAWPGYRGESGA